MPITAGGAGAAAPAADEAVFITLIQEKKEAEALDFLKTHPRFSPKGTDENGYTALFLATKFGLNDLETRLTGHRYMASYISTGAIGNTKWLTPAGFYLLLSIIERNDLDAFKVVLKTGHLPSLKLVDSKDMVLTSYIASLGRLDMLRLVVAANSQEVDSGNTLVRCNTTPIIAAAENRHADVVAYLLENGADASFTTSEGKTVLSVAETNGDSAILALLRPAAPAPGSFDSRTVGICLILFFLSGP